jgi:excisionase family DNA binding protein
MDQMYEREDCLIGSDEVAKLLGVTVNWVRDHTTRREPIVPHVKLGRKILFERDEVVRFIRECRESRPTWERTRIA